MAGSDPEPQALEGADRRRERFEGREDYYEVRARLQQKCLKSTAGEVEDFKQLLMDKGAGKIALAWRRYFDSDGDNHLSFKEFCNALAVIGYKGDIPSLWAQLRSDESLDDAPDLLRLEDLDPEHALFLDVFRSWCVKEFGGPTEVFRAIDVEHSDSLNKENFVSGLKALGFFQQQLPSGLSSEDLVVRNLFPLMDSNGTGCITPEQLLFLEKDRERRMKIERQLARIRAHGIQAAPEPLRNDAQRMLFRLSMKTTQLGGKHWKNVHSLLACGESASFDAKRSWTSPGLEAVRLAKTPRQGSAERLHRISLPSPIPCEGQRCLTSYNSRSAMKDCKLSSRMSSSCPALPNLTSAMLEDITPEDTSNQARQTPKARKVFIIPRASFVRI